MQVAKYSSCNIMCCILSCMHPERRECMCECVHECVWGEGGLIQYRCAWCIGFCLSLGLELASYIPSKVDSRWSSHSVQCLRPPLISRDLQAVNSGSSVSKLCYFILCFHPANQICTLTMPRTINTMTTGIIIFMEQFCMYIPWTLDAMPRLGLLQYKIIIIHNKHILLLLHSKDIIILGTKKEALK